VADKLTQQIIDALSKAAADPAGLPLFAGKTDPGLFPSSAAAKPAAQKCLADGLVRVTRTETRGKAARELYGLTDKGWEFLLAAVNPRQVLEDFVRVLEARQGEVGELLDTARQMASSLQGLKDAVARVLPQVSTGKLIQPPPPARLPDAATDDEAVCEEVLARQTSSYSLAHAEAEHANGTAVLDVPVVVVAPGAEPVFDLADTILARLTDWAASARVGEDCPLPDLFRQVITRELRPTIGEFHDCLRRLAADGEIYLHPWTAPLYALPEPAYALLAGHNIAYYASIKN
jgi:DNA-binding PadR family transcriptional regulator